MALSYKDTIQLANWLGGRASLASVEAAERIGLVGNERFSERARRRFIVIWTWSAFRYGGRAAAAQERWYKLCGDAGFYRRQKRVINLARRYDPTFDSTLAPGRLAQGGPV